jgi:hypothetical protein
MKLQIIAILLATSIAESAPIVIPQSGPYTSDANTLILEHFDGTVTGTTQGTPSFATGYFSQGMQFNDTSRIYWSLGAQSQGTMELWVKLDSNSNTEGSDITNIAFSSMNLSFGPTGYIETYDGVTRGGTTRAGINAAPFNWNDFPDGPALSLSAWHHLAVTWGSLGLRYYVDGDLVRSNANTSGQNTATTVWGVGFAVTSGAGFNGVADEFRVSNVQRTFSPAPEPTTCGLLLLGSVLLCSRRRAFAAR